MTMMKVKTAGLALVLGIIALSVSSIPVQAEGPAIEPEAKQLLKRMTDYLAGLDKFSVDTDNMLEDVLVSGQKIQYDFTATVGIQRPDKVRAERTGDLFQQVIVYDGKTLTIYNPGDNYYAQAAAPDNIDDTLHFARDTLDFVPPIGDVVYTDAYELLMTSVTEGFVVGKSMVGGVRCDHLAFRTPVVDWQIWIADGDEPLPYKYVLTTMDDPAQPQYLVLISNWNVTPSFDTTHFQFTKPEGAKEIDFLRMDTGQ